MLVELGVARSDWRSQPTTSTTSVGVFKICSPGSSAPIRTSSACRNSNARIESFPKRRFAGLADRSYFASRMATRMNIAQPEAEKRIDDAFARLNQAKESAKQTAERARRMGVIPAFLTAAAPLIGAAAA
jgi:hypothetical protein